MQVLKNWVDYIRDKEVEIVVKQKGDWFNIDDILPVEVTILIKVYINDKLTFEGGVRSTGRNIGISPRTISKLKTKEAKHLPKHATCDYIVINGVAFHKKRHF